MGRNRRDLSFSPRLRGCVGSCNVGNFRSFKRNLGVKPLQSFDLVSYAHGGPGTRQLLSAPKIITELILERAGPVIFKTFLLKLIAFRPIPVIFPARGAKPENYWKR